MFTPRYLLPVALLVLGLCLPSFAAAEMVQHLHGWRVGCSRDAMHDRVTCSADRHGLVIGLSGPSHEPWLALRGGQQQYPGTACYLRVDTLQRGVIRTSVSGSADLPP
jgi:hypothetical protein